MSLIKITVDLPPSLQIDLVSQTVIIVQSAGSGEQGPPGPAGPQGEPGEQGPQGIQGPIGLTGPKGDTGDTGPQGIQGVKGDTGDTGPQGPIGLTGPAGPQGEQGIQGIQGIQGVQGEPGEDGADGATGPQGEQGPTGATGPQGPTGPAGTGIATGGTAGQFLKKASGTDYDTTWADVTNYPYLFAHHSAFSGFVDGNNYYFDDNVNLALGGTENQRCGYAPPYNITVVGYQIITFCTSAGTSNQASTLYFRHTTNSVTTDETLSSSVIFSSSTQTPILHTSAITPFDLNANDPWKIKILIPNPWTTKATGAQYRVKIFYKHR